MQRSHAAGNCVDLSSITHFHVILIFAAQLIPVLFNFTFIDIIYICIYIYRYILYILKARNIDIYFMMH